VREFSEVICASLRIIAHQKNSRDRRFLIFGLSAAGLVCVIFTHFQEDDLGSSAENPT
jgi:hypothetical protein